MFKDLMLNRDSIISAIDSYCKENYTHYSVQEEEMCFGKRYTVSFNSTVLVLDAYHNKKGGTTLAVNSGKPALLDDRKKLAQYIVESPLCVMAAGSDHNRSMLFKDISREDFENIISAIADEDDCKAVFSREENDNNIIVKMEGRWSDRVTVSYFPSTKNVLIQGRPLLLFSLCASLLNELVEEEVVVECLDNTYSLNLSGKTIEEQYVLLFPKSHDKHSAKLKKSLLKAIYNLNLDQQEYGCTELVFEALRALEGHIKLTLLRDFSIESPNKKGLLSFFSYDSSTHTVTIDTEQEGKIATPMKIQYYKDAYKYYVEYRHKMFHWDYPDKVENDITEHLDDIADAHRIIQDTLALIEKYY